MATIQWFIDKTHTQFFFKIRHMMISAVQGSFKSFEGTVTSEDDDWLTLKIELTIDPASIDSGAEGRDKHLKTKDFFDVETYKTIHFISTKVEKYNDDYKLYGDFTMHGVTHPIVLILEASSVIDDPFGNKRAGFMATGHLSRKSFGMDWNGNLPGGGLLLGDDILLNCELEIIHK